LFIHVYDLVKKTCIYVCLFIHVYDLVKKTCALSVFGSDSLSLLRS